MAAGFENKTISASGYLGSERSMFKMELQCGCAVLYIFLRLSLDKIDIRLTLKEVSVMTFFFPFLLIMPSVFRNKCSMLCTSASFSSFLWMSQRKSVRMSQRKSIC